MDVTRPRKPASGAMIQELRYAADIGGENRRAHRQCFDHDHRLTFEPQRREDEAPDRTMNLEYFPVLHRAREPGTRHAHRFKRFAPGTVANHKKLEVLDPGEPPGRQEPAHAFFARSRPM